MGRRAKSTRPRLLDVVLTALLSLFLAVVAATVSGVVAAGADGRLPVGPVGDWIGTTVRDGVGPFLLWLLPLLPWAWIPLRRAASKRQAVVRGGWAVVFVLAVSSLLAHDHLDRLGVPPGAGGRIGEWAEGLLASVVGPVGSFLVLASLGSWLVLRPMPPLRLPLPAIDGLAARVNAAFAPLLGATTDAFRGLGEGMSALGNRLLDARDAWREERAQARQARAVHDRDAGRVDDTARTDAEELEEADEDYEYEYEDDEYEDEDGEYEDEDGEYEDDAEVDEFVADATDVEPVPDAIEPAPARVVEAGVAPPPSWARQGADASEEFRLSRDPTELLDEDDPELAVPKRRRRRGDYPLPSLDLLEEVKKEQRGFSRDVLQMNARLLLETLGNFGIDGQINEIRPGPVVTTFEFEPAPGVKVSQIVSRGDDLALAMRATRIRIEAPIPGKAAVGIEIPNPYPQMVGLRQVISSLGSDPNDVPLEIAFGKDTEGEPFAADLADMPHLLVAGATGSGKSVCINAIICNLLLRNGPDRVRMLMIDPKMLELSVYNGIPHLMHPVITQASDALKAVKYMVAEMETRYARLSRHGVRNIAAFNEKVRAGKAVDEKTNEKIKEPLPYVVFVIDELADLMMQLGSDLETPVARLAQMARAVGIHLVLATQRPSVNVITGVIKANFPSRIGFRVISKVDSRTILDGQGAEQLLGKGDMLFLMAGRAQPVRVHGAFVSMDECESVVEHWRQFGDDAGEPIDLDQGKGAGGGIDLGEDDLLEQARALVVATQMGSTTMLQRRLRVGYTRAARLMDMLEAAGVVGPFEGSKARKVLVDKDELEAEN
ncbi:MAG TPA: DNA translocase FtsK 4TM domain-containing protein [Candidatus Krumholzibacteria bacterium]|nr:DNA translocase FtsK 4TM domain-containing protein [Candidatus Krumholzibacteria bacterium]